MASELTRRRFLEAAGVATAVGAGTAAATATAQNSETVKRVKILGICCSPRKGKTTSQALAVTLEAAAEVSHRIEVEQVELGDLKIDGALAAGIPLEEGAEDDFPSLIPKLTDERLGGLVIGTPVYMGNMSSLCKAFIDRLVAVRRDFALADKVAGVVAVAGGRNGGQELTIRSVHNSLLGQGMIIVGDAPPTAHWGGTVWSGAPGGVMKDEYGLTSARNLGRHVAEVAMRLTGDTSLPQ